MGGKACGFYEGIGIQDGDLLGCLLHPLLDEEQKHGRGGEGGVLILFRFDKGGFRVGGFEILFWFVLFFFLSLSFLECYEFGGKKYHLFCQEGMAVTWQKFESLNLL